MRAGALLAFALALLVASGARAQVDDPPELTRAKELFKKGLAMLDAGDCERATEYFVASRAAVPGKGNTVNLAVCLDRIGRYDEALELYEEALTRFADALEESDRRALAPAMETLRKKVGTLAISANVAGSVLVDGRPRGKLPLPPLRVNAGDHLVRVLKEGFVTADLPVRVVVGETVTLDAKLVALVAKGQLRLEDPTNEGANAFVDSVAVGALPWEGTLAPGEHVVWIAKGDRGSGPTRVFVVEGQLALVKLASAPLGPVTQIAVEPSTARIAVDDVELDHARWEGRLPVGAHTIRASEAGYFARTERVVVGDASGARTKTELRLLIDKEHPRWPKRALGELFLGAFGGAALGGGFGGAVDTACASITCGGASGYTLGARGGFRFPFGLALEIEGGYQRASARSERALADRFGPMQQYDVAYHLVDDLALRGPFFGGGASFRLGLGKVVGLTARAIGGAWLVTATDPITGTATAGGATAPIGVSQMDERLASAQAFFAPELGLDARFGKLSIGASLATWIALGAGPSFAHPQIEVTPACSPQSPSAVGCAKGSAAVRDERAFGSFVLFVPQISASYALGTP